jgi:hypothetical protein
VSGALRATLAAEGGLLAAALGPADGAAEAPAPAAIAAAGPRAAAAPDEYSLLVSAVHEGHLLHAGAPRVVTAADPDLALLAGDRLYALGLDRLARLGDLDAVAELADAISSCAQALAANEPQLAAAAFDAAASGIGWGQGAELASAKEAARAGAPDRAERLHAAARAVRGSASASRGQNAPQA